MKFSIDHRKFSSKPSQVYPKTVMQFKGGFPPCNPDGVYKWLVHYCISRAQISYKEQKTQNGG